MDCIARQGGIKSSLDGGNLIGNVKNDVLGRNAIESDRVEGLIGIVAGKRQSGSVGAVGRRVKGDRHSSCIVEFQVQGTHIYAEGIIITRNDDFINFQIFGADIDDIHGKCPGRADAGVGKTVGGQAIIVSRHNNNIRHITNADAVEGHRHQGIDGIVAINLHIIIIHSRRIGRVGNENFNRIADLKHGRRWS